MLRVDQHQGEVLVQHPVSEFGVPLCDAAIERLDLSLQGLVHAGILPHSRSFVLAALGTALLAAACGGSDDASTTPTTGASTTTAAASGEADIDELFVVVGHKLHLACMGSGSPTVLIEMGAGQRISAWNGTLPVFAEERRACVYERAATGDSEPGPEPRTSQVIADELAALVEAAGLQTPLIVVSHSLGGMHAQAFAQRHSDLVAGLVFVEPRTAEYHFGYSEHITPEEVASRWRP